MTALTIDIADQLVAGLRETAARRNTTVDAVVESVVSDALANRGAPGSFHELAERAPLSFEAGRTWDREEIHARPVLR